MLFLKGCPMDPKGFFKKKRAPEDKKEFSFALEINPGLVKGALWTIEAGKAKVVSASQPIPWQENSLIEAADKAFSEAIEKATLGEEEEPKKIIFGLPFSWVKGEKIVPEKLKTLKELCRSLGLRPVGFVVTVEAIIKYLKSTEGVSPNAILVSLLKNDIGITLLRLGKIVGHEKVVQSGQLGEDVAEGLARIKSEEVLPSRIILYDSGENIEERKEEILNFPWLEKEKGFNFLHLPKAEVPPVDFDIKAVALAGGAEVAKSEGIEAEILVEKPVESKEAAKPAPAEAVPPEPSQRVPTESVSAEGGPSKEELAPTEAVSSEGGPEEKPIASLPAKPSSKELGFGFQKAKDITTFPQPSFSPKEPGFPKPEEPLKKKKKPFSLKALKIPVLRPLDFLKKLGRPFKKVAPKVRLPTTLPTLVILASFLLLVLGGGLFWFWWFVPKAKVVLFVKPQVLEKEFKLTLDADAQEIDSAEMIIPAELAEVTLQGEKEAETTGTKIIGEKAKGEITLYNRTAAEKNLKAGTVLAGPSGLEFSLDEEIIVASESAGPDYTKIPGKATGKATALAIGSESNLASGTEFEVSKYSSTDLVARNDSAFSGGTSREVKVVSDNDRKNLHSSLLEELRPQARKELAEKALDEKVLVEESFAEKISEERFDKAAEEEADRLKLSLSVSFQSLLYQRKKLSNLVQEKIKSSISSGFEFREEKSEVTFKLDEVLNERKALFSASFKATLWPKIDQDQIRKNLRGKRQTLGESYLNGLPNLLEYEVVFTPNLPSAIKTFPRVLENIEIELKSN
jgi:hypothetical protein